MNPFAGRIACFLLLLASLFCTGCISSRYKMVSKRATAVPVPMNLESASPQLNATVSSVIVFRGPGSWKKNAYWDEYMVAFENKGTETVVIDSAALTSLNGELIAPGSNPWELEKASRTVERRFVTGTGTALKIGAGFAVSVVPSAAIAFGTVMGGTASAGASLVAAVATPAFVVGTVYRNVSGRSKVQAEFARRRLALPITLEPGQRVEGSLFFQITPGPRQLAVNCTTSGEKPVAIVPLPQLASLHLAR